LPTWMVVEDEPDIYDVLLAMFEIWGIDGVAFVDGAEAVAWIESVDQGRVRGELPELAILDIRLPEISGPEVSARLRRSPILGEIGIVLITAYRLSPDDEAAVMEQAKADLLMYKPLPSMVELRSTMADAIARRTAQPERLPAPAARKSPGVQPAPAPRPAPSVRPSMPMQQRTRPQAPPKQPKNHRGLAD